MMKERLSAMRQERCPRDDRRLEALTASLVEASGGNGPCGDPLRIADF